MTAPEPREDVASTPSCSNLPQELEQPREDVAVAEVLGKHFWECSDERICACGWQPDDYQERLGDWDDDRDYAWLDQVVAPTHAAHVAEALAPLIAEREAKAWDEGYTTGNAHNGRRDANPYRADRRAER